MAGPVSEKVSSHLKVTSSQSVQQQKECDDLKEISADPVSEQNFQSKVDVGRSYYLQLLFKYMEVKPFGIFSRDLYCVLFVCEN